MLFLSDGPVRIGRLVITKRGTVTGAAGAATVHAVAAKVTTESLATAAGGEVTYTVTDNKVKATDIVLASVTTTGTGTPALSKVTPANGSIVFVIKNDHATVAFNAALVISFVLIG